MSAVPAELPPGLAQRTEVLLTALDGDVAAGPGWWRMALPELPTHFDANYLALARPPAEGELERWLAVFERELGAPFGVRHVAFGWHGVGGALGPFRDAGFEAWVCDVHAGGAVELPRRADPEVVVRPLAREAEWSALVALELLERPAHLSETAFLDYLLRRTDRYRRLVAAGHGEWLGAFHGDALVGALGVFHVGEGLARYQSVLTHPEHRRRGIARRLVAEGGRRALARPECRTLVLTSDSGSSASRVYVDAGLAVVARTEGVFRRPRGERT